jgi:hypothetical protein
VRRSLKLSAVGVILVAAYLGALALTVGSGADHVRPLYDGFAPPPSYRWVEPPSFFASGNVKPTALTTTVTLGRNGSEAAGIATPDGQFVLNLGSGAIAPSGDSKKVRVTITPVPPSTLRRVPSPLRANGNAYRVAMAYDTGTKVSRLRHPGSLVMDIPELGNDLFVTGPGTGWTKIPSNAVPPRQLSLAADFSTPGTYLAGTRLPELVAPSGASSDHSVAIGLGTAALTAVVLVAAFVLVRRRHRRAAPVNTG